MVKITNKKHLQLIAKDINNKPQLKFDGIGAIQVKDSFNITIKNLEIEGPALRINGAEASDNRKRLTGRNQGGCGAVDVTSS